MAGSGSMSLLRALVLLRGGMAATLSSERGSDSFVRRESQRAVDISNSGQLSRDQPMLKETAKVMSANFSSVHASGPMGYCDTEYIEGPDKTTNCTAACVPGAANADACDTSSIRLIDSEAACAWAQTETGGTAYVGIDGMSIDQSLEQVRPKGCFKACDAEGANCKVGWNTVPGFPDTSINTFKGNAICARKKHIFGTVGSEADTNCATDYALINDWKSCKQAASCMGIAEAPHFWVGTNNRSQHLDFVQGCFIHPVDDNGDSVSDTKVYFNNATLLGKCSENIDANWRPSCKGTQICKLSASLDLSGR